MLTYRDWLRIEAALFVIWNRDGDNVVPSDVWDVLDEKESALAGVPEHDLEILHKVAHALEVDVRERYTWQPDQGDLDSWVNGRSGVCQLIGNGWCGRFLGLPYDLVTGFPDQETCAHALERVLCRNP